MSNQEFVRGQSVRIKENGDRSNKSHIPQECIIGKFATIIRGPIASHGSGSGFSPEHQYMKYEVAVQGSSDSYEVYDNWMETVEVDPISRTGG